MKERQSRGLTRRHSREAIRSALRELRMQLSLLNHRVGAHLELRNVDLDCLDLVARHGPQSPSSLAQRAGLHPATMTGILDRLEHAGWVERKRDPQDRRAVVVHPVRARVADILTVYAGMNGAVDRICSAYDDDQLGLLADFLSRVASAGQTEAAKLASGGES